MSLWSALFGGSNVASVEDLERQVAQLSTQGRHADIVRVTADFRERAERNRSLDEPEKLRRVGIACALSLPALTELARQTSGQKRYETLRAFCASFVAGHIAFQGYRRTGTWDEKHRDWHWREKAFSAYEAAGVEFADDGFEQADIEANEIISRGIRGY